MQDDNDSKILERLDSSIKDAKSRLLKNEESGVKSYSNGIGLGYKIMVELLAGVIVGSMVGYYLDLWLKTKPIMFIICFILGVCGSGLNIYRSVNPRNNN